MLYLDTSALVKRYLIEPGAADIGAAMAEHRTDICTSVITYAEILSAFARATREGVISSLAHRRHKKEFFMDWPGLTLVDLTPGVLAPAERVIERHALRGFDAVHLCSALWMGKPDFACFDDRLRRAAAAEGLPVIP